MGAYLGLLALSCNKTGCGRKATHEVFNTFNARCGQFCEPHAKERLKKIIDIDNEKQMAKRRPK